VRCDEETFVKEKISLLQEPSGYEAHLEYIGWPANVLDEGRGAKARKSFRGGSL
jgi:hypothetical protein